MVEKFIGRTLVPAFFLLSILITLCNCSVLDPEGQRLSLVSHAINNGWTKKITKTQYFDISTLIKLMDAEQSHVVVYIEGDGIAWLDTNTVSENPTPQRPIGLRLAINDPFPNILYLGRPCQYVKHPYLRNCHPKYWTHHRYSAEVIDSLNQAINSFMKQNHLSSLEIIGYSGGGSIAALISDKRNDVLRFVTVAANLDIDEWAKYLNVSPLWGSMNPVKNSLRSRFIKQFHLSGSNDTIVPTAVLKNYLIKTKITNPESLILLNGYTHSCCWHKGWKDMITKIRSNILSKMQNNVSGCVIDNGSTRNVVSLEMGIRYEQYTES